jgi:hypothetical protein
MVSVGISEGLRGCPRGYKRDHIVSTMGKTSWQQLEPKTIPTSGEISLFIIAFL